jgi:TonB family protein
MTGGWAPILVALGLASSPADAPSETPDVADAPEQLVAPVRQRPADAPYPPALLELAVPPRGRVVVELTIGIDGTPRELRVITSVHPDLDDAALAAVATWRYEPASLLGEPVEIVTEVAIDYAPGPKVTPEPTVREDEEAPPELVEEAVAPGPVRLAGTIVEAGQRTAIGGAQVLVIDARTDASLGVVRKHDYAEDPPPRWQARALTDATGEFAVRGTGDGKVRVIVLAPGFERLEVVESLPPDEQLTVRYYLRRLSTHPYRTEVSPEQIEREEVSRKTLRVEEIDNLPGSQGDALKAIQNLPGINRAPFGIGLLVIRGADPTDSAVFLADHEIPQLFHFGGVTSVFNSDVLEQIDYIPGNFDARYGDAVGGIIDAKPRRGRRDGVHGYVDSDLFDTGVLLEGPVGAGSFVLSGRRSYIDLLLPAVVPDDAGLDLAVAPRYYDYQALFDYPVTRGMLSAKVFGSDDRTKVVTADPNEVDTDDRDAFETTLLFHRADLAYTYRRGPWDILLTPSYRFDSYSAGAFDIFRFTVRGHSGSGRAEVGYRISRHLHWSVGTQVLGGVYTIDAESPPVPTPGAGSTGQRLSTSTTTPFFAPALFTTLAIGLGDDVVLYPSVRLTYYALAFQRARTDPRLRLRWQAGDRTVVKGGVGLYSQVPDVPEFNARFGNGRIGTESALHTSVAVSHEFDYDIELEVAGFYKTLWDLATPSTQLVARVGGRVGPENFTNAGRGRIYGGEIFVRKQLGGSLFGWVSYTLSRSERKADARAPWTRFDLDQTHILTLIGVVALPRGWQFGARFRVVSGNPYTPVVGSVYDPGDDAYIPVQGAKNSERVAAFHQLDLRVDKRWTFRRFRLTTYLDVLNAYNQQNPELAIYSYDYARRSTVPSLPIIPSLGLEAEF